MLTAVPAGRAVGRQRMPIGSRGHGSYDITALTSAVLAAKAIAAAPARDPR